MSQNYLDRFPHPIQPSGKSQDSHYPGPPISPPLATASHPSPRRLPSHRNYIQGFPSRHSQNPPAPLIRPYKFLTFSSPHRWFGRNSKVKDPHGSYYSTLPEEASQGLSRDSPVTLADSFISATGYTWALLLSELSHGSGGSADPTVLPPPSGTALVSTGERRTMSGGLAAALTARLITLSCGSADALTRRQRHPAVTRGHSMGCENRRLLQMVVAQQEKRWMYK
ncbi:unnamed protein product [Lota lota]